MCSSISTLLDQVDASSALVQTNLSSCIEWIKTWLDKLRMNQLPQWAIQHIHLHNLLKQEWDEMRSRGDDKTPLGNRIRQSYKTSRKAFKAIARGVEYSLFKQAIFPPESTETYCGLFETPARLHPTQTEAFTNLALLISVYQRTENETLKKIIEFLAMNYLNKAASIRSIDGLVVEEDTRKILYRGLQLGVISDSVYHRENRVYEDTARAKIKELLAPDIVRDFELIDTKEIQELLGMFFPVIPVSIQTPPEEQRQRWADGFVNAFNEYRKGVVGDPMAQTMKTFMLLDLTVFFKDLIVTGGNPANNAKFAEAKQKLESEIEAAIDLAVVQLLRQSPCSNDEALKLKIFLKANLGCICRIQLKEVNILITLSMFESSTNFRLPLENVASEKACLFFEEKYTLKIDSHGSIFLTDRAQRVETLETLAASIQRVSKETFRTQLHVFLTSTGTRIGAVNARRQIPTLLPFFEFYNLDNASDVQYQPSGMNVLIFPKREDFVRTEVFRKLKTYTDPNNPSFAILGLATANLIEGLLQDISPEKWDLLNRDLDSRMILQQTLFRLQSHLANAVHHRDDFVLFTQSLELAHCEIAALLTLACPYEKSTFPTIFCEWVRTTAMVPPEFRTFVTAGLCKTAMNAFAGICWASHEMNPGCQVVTGDNPYFEEGEGAFPGTCPMKKAMGDPRKVGLYVGQFYRNIQHTMTWENYPADRVIEDVEELLRSGKAAEHMTVAIDVTIDYSDSVKVHRLLERFSQEIREGRLNFVFFRSGQKFDMLGMDNYYGAPFWCVNNGKPGWNVFAELSKREAFQTDDLTNQWFCLLWRRAPHAVDAYKHQYFLNADALSDAVPPEIRPRGKYASMLRINTFDRGVIHPFIDIKLFPKSGLMRIGLKIMFLEKAASHNTRATMRGSFGFYNPNFISIPSLNDHEYTSMRINPGLNPKDNEFIIEFFHDLVELLAESQLALDKENMQTAASHSLPVQNPAGDADSASKELLLAKSETAQSSDKSTTS